MRRTIELYGRLRQAGDAVELDLPQGSTAGQALALLKKKLGAAVEGSALATEDAVLGKDEKVPIKGRLAALPPVCGG